MTSLVEQSSTVEKLRWRQNSVVMDRPGSRREKEARCSQSIYIYNHMSIDLKCMAVCSLGTLEISGLFIYEYFPVYKFRDCEYYLNMQLTYIIFLLKWC